MARKIGVSRHGLTRCPGCGQHMKVAKDLGSTVCPFCNTSIRAEPAPASVVTALRTAARSFFGSRGSLLAAALLGPAPMVACETDTAEGRSSEVTDTSTSNEDGTATDGTDDVVTPVDDTDPGPQPLYGLPSDAFDPVADVEDTGPGPQPLYGLPPTDAFTPIEDVIEDSGPGPQPLYGLPPTDTFTPIEEVSEDAGPGPTPLYGLPPSDTFSNDEELDAGESQDADPNPVPLYGVPPSPQESPAIPKRS